MFTGELKPYQEEPVSRFLDRGNLLVAYEMGLGKTVIGIAAAENLLMSRKIDRCIVVCPASIKFQWKQRIHDFTNRFAWVVDGDAKKRKELYDLVNSGLYKVDYLIMSYDIVMRDKNYISSIVLDKCMVILDEATAIKTFKAQRTKIVKRSLKAKYRLALTGTPIENRPDELFSIMQWVDPKVLGRYDLFDKAYCKRNRYGWVIGYKNLPTLRNRISPAMSRKSRLNPDVRPYLPEVDYTEDWHADISSDVRKLYKKIAADMLTEMSKIDPRHGFDLSDFYGNNDESTATGKIMAMYMCLEMLLDHPDLIIISAKNGAKYANYLWQEGLLDSILESQKLDLLKEKVSEILQYPDNKIVIFTFYKGMLDMIEEELDVKCAKFHGDMVATGKDMAIRTFATDPDCRILLSSHAGAYGCDLYMANYLINYDQPWSAGKADQINGRHVRVSSEFSKVYVRDILASETIDEWKKRKVERKRRIAGSIVDGYGHDDDGTVDVSGDTLKAHLEWVVKNW